MKYKFLLLINILCCNLVYSKILILTFAYNRPEFIELQYQTFKKFLQDDYELVVVNDAIKTIDFEAIAEMCKNYSLRHIPVPQYIHQISPLPREINDSPNAPSIRNSNVVKFGLDQLGYDHDDIVALFDSDLFLVKPFSIRNYLGASVMAGLPQERKGNIYYWIGLVFINIPILPDKRDLHFNVCHINNVALDSGGSSFYYIKNHPNLNYRNLDNQQYPEDYVCDECKFKNISCFHLTQKMINDGFNYPLIKLIQNGAREMDIFEHGTFLHYRGGSNWTGHPPEYHVKKTLLLKNFMADLLHS